MDTFVYSTDPGLSALLDKGSVTNIVQIPDTATAPPSPGLGVLGTVGALINDRGAVNVPVELFNGAQDFDLLYGGFKTYLGDGSTTGYEGNCAAQAWKVAAPRWIHIAVDLALHDKTYTDATKVTLEPQVTRGWSITGESDSDLITADRAHGRVAGDTVKAESFTGGSTFSAAGTLLYVLASGLTSTAFKVSLTDGGAAVALGTDITVGLMYPVDSALPAFTMPAGTRLKTAGGFIVRTLESVTWALGVAGSQTVRVAKVSGAVAALNTITIFVDTLQTDEIGVIVTTTVTTVPDDTDAGEIVLRYTAAFAGLRANTAGQAIGVLACDRNESAINDAMADAVTDARAAGQLLRCVTAPPIGTLLAGAVASTGDGVARTTLDRDVAAYVWPEWERTFLPDEDSLTAPAYRAKFTGTIAFAAAIAATPEEENPAQASAMMRSAGFNQIGQTLTLPERLAAYRAGIAQPELKDFPNETFPGYRDGIFADKSKIANGRLWDFVAKNTSAYTAPYRQKALTDFNITSMGDGLRGWLSTLRNANPNTGNKQRIRDFAVSVVPDPDNDQAIVTVLVRRLGNADVITIRQLVTGRALDAAA